MSEEEMQDKALASARTVLGGKTEVEKASILHQHIGSRAMSDMVIETLVASSGSSQPLFFFSSFQRYLNTLIGTLDPSRELCLVCREKHKGNPFNFYSGLILHFWISIQGLY